LPQRSRQGLLADGFLFQGEVGASGVRLVGFGLGVDAPQSCVRASVASGLIRSRQGSFPNLTVHDKSEQDEAQAGRLSSSSRDDTFHI
jgi:hypothetical protein